MSEMERLQEQESESEEKFQHNNSSSKIGEENGWGGVLFIPQKAKWGHLDETQVSHPKQEHQSQEGGAQVRV